MSRKLLGLDIRRDRVSAILVKSGIKGSWIEQHVTVPIVAGTQSFEKELGQALDAVASQIQTADAVCLVALPASHVTYRNLQAPFNEIKKLRQILPFELETDLPFSADEIAFDFKLIENPLRQEKPQLFTAAIEKQRIDAYVEQLGRINLQPDILTIGGYALGQYVAHMSPDSPCQLFVEISKADAIMVLSLSGNVSLVRCFRYNSNQPNAEHQLAAQVKRTLLAFAHKSGLNCALEDVRISAESLTDTNLETTLEAALGAPVSRIDLMQVTSRIMRSAKSGTWQPHLMDGALAMVLNELSGFDSFNFRRGRMGMGKVWNENKRDILKTCGLAGVVALLFIGYGIFSSYTLKQRVDLKKAEVLGVFQSTFPEITQIVDPVHQMRTKLAEAQKGISLPGETISSVRTIDILNDISRLIPENLDVALLSIVSGGDNVLVSGNTDTFNAVDDIKTGLEQSDIFKTVSISSANMDKSGKRVRFKLKVAI